MIFEMLTLLAMAPPPLMQNDIVGARRALTTCLMKLAKSEGDAKTAADEFGTKLDGACKGEEERFRAAVVAVDVKAGIKRADAEENANMEIGDLRANAKDTFDTYAGG